jgi:hypothetical protein
MKRILLAVALALAAPLAGWASSGVAGENLAQALLSTTSFNNEMAQQDKSNPFQFHLAPVAFFSFDEELNDLMTPPIWGGEAGFVYWISQQLGLGLSGQYFSASGTGDLDNIEIDADFTYYNVFVNIYSKMLASDSVSLYGLGGMGYSNAHLAGEAQTFLFSGDFDQVDEGVGYQAGLGISGPWVFGEVRYSESSFGAEENTEGEKVVTILNALQVLVGVRTP